MAEPAEAIDKDRKPLSFTRGLFEGIIHDSLLFPYPAGLSVRAPEEMREVRRLLSALDHLQDTIVDSAKFDEEEKVSEEAITAFADAGLLGMTIPREYGGLGLSVSGYARVFEAISGVDPSLAVLVGVHCGLGSKAIVLFGNDEQKSWYLPRLAKGETLAAYALTEPDIGSDARHIKATAIRSESGDWILNGRKLWIGNGHRAGVIATFAQTQVERNGKMTNRPTAFIIRPDMPGFKVLRTIRKLGIRGSTQAELEYTNLEVPSDHLLGTVGAGFDVAVHVLNAGRLTLVAGSCGGMKRILQEAAIYAEQRIQFGHPLAHFEITQRKYAEIASGLYACDAMLGTIAAIADIPESDFSLEAACAKVFASDLLWHTADEMVQIAGGRGFVKPYPYERILRDARINRIFEGANEVLRLFVALTGIQDPGERLKEVSDALRAPLGNLGILGEYATARVRRALGGTATLDVDLAKPLRKHKDYFERHVAQLKGASDRAITRYRRNIVDRQLVLERLANMAIELFATACVLARTQGLILERGEELCEHEIALCDLFCVEAGRRFRDHRNALDEREDEVDDRRREIAATVRQRQGYAVEDPLLP
jgi:alkylation response protein AidB-like acyl-CoA dehydrogenase